MAFYVAVAALAVGSYSAYEGHESRKEAQENYNKSAEEQRKAQQEKRALQFQEQAQERRNQVREERVRRAKIMQASENTGVGDSSGLVGATSSLSTQLNNNMGIMAGRAAAGDRISGYLQNAADFNTAAQSAVFDAQNADQLFSLSTSVFSAAGGFGAFKPAKKV
jgi:hypothetical protein